MNKPNIFIRAMTWIWHGVDGFRKLVHQFFLVMVFGLFFFAILQ